MYLFFHVNKRGSKGQWVPQKIDGDPWNSPGNLKCMCQASVKKLFCFHLMTSSWEMRLIVHTTLLGPRRVVCTIKRNSHDDVIKWKHFPRYRLFVRGNHWSPAGSLTKASDTELWSTNGWANNRNAGDLGHHCAHYYVTLMAAMFYSPYSPIMSASISLYNTLPCVYDYIHIVHYMILI